MNAQDYLTIHTHGIALKNVKQVLNIDNLSDEGNLLELSSKEQGIIDLASNVAVGDHEKTAISLCQMMWS